MPKPKLVIAQPSLPPETRELLQQDFELIYTDPNNSDTLHRDLSQAAALFPASLQVDEALLSHARPYCASPAMLGLGTIIFTLTLCAAMVSWAPTPPLYWMTPSPTSSLA